MSRRSERAAQVAAEQASEAARVLQKRGQEAKAEQVEKTEPDQEWSGGHYVKGRNPAREEAMEQIIRDRNRREGIKDEESSEDKKEEVKAETPKKEEPVEEKAEQPEVKAEESAEPEVKAEAVEGETEPVEAKEELVLVKVNGKEYQVPKSEVDAAGGVVAYQKNRAADERLESIKQLEKIARENQLAQLRQRQEEAKKRQAAQQATFLQKAQERYQQLREIVQFGEPQQAFAAQIEMQRIVSALADNQNQRQTQFKAELKMEAASSVIADEFPEIFKDQDLMAFAHQIEVSELRKRAAEVPNYTPRQWQEFYRGIGNRIRAKMGGAKPAAQTAQTTGKTTPMSEKEARKASIVSLPSAAARAAPQKDEKPETRDDILNEMRKARGLPTG